MDYYLLPAFLSAPPPMEITEDEYQTLLGSRIVLDAAFSFEENYDLLIGNYLELENSALTLATSTMLRQIHEYHDMFELTSELNRRAVNFLSSARLFVDQILQRVRACGGERSEIEKRLNKEYDDSFEYRFMEALRNHVQHSGSAVHGLSFGGQWVPPREKIARVFSVEAYTQKRFLALDPKFKKSVFQECPDQVDFLNSTRHYVEALSNIHELARSRIQEHTSRARASFADAISAYKKFSDASALGLSAYATVEGSLSEATAIFLDWDDVRLKMQGRNRHLHNLSRCVISSCPKGG